MITAPTKLNPPDGKDPDGEDWFPESAGFNGTDISGELHEGCSDTDVRILPDKLSEELLGSEDKIEKLEKNIIEHNNIIKELKLQVHIFEQNNIIKELKLQVHILQQKVHILQQTVEVLKSSYKEFKELNRQIRILQRDTWFNKCLNGLDKF